MAEKAKPVSSMAILDRVGRGGPVPAPEPMPLPEARVRLPMRDGIRLDTSVWLPAAALGTPPDRVPAILLRTPYKESVMGFRRLGVLRYVEAGYAVVIQQIRGVGASEGRFTFNSPDDRTDGYDTVEWIAAEPWCDGHVGMDGSSYVGMTQLTAASERPPHLRCIVPAVPVLDPFREVPYCGGIFARSHTINWTRILQVESINELRTGFMGTMPILATDGAYDRLTSRPALAAADDQLEGDFLAHYRDVLAHPTRDDCVRARTIDAADLAKIDIPALVVSGNFDLGIGAMLLWNGLEANAGNAAERRLLVGPWDHGQCYAGGEVEHGPYAMGEASVLDLVALRLAFFDKHLKHRGTGPDIGPSPGDRVKVFITGANAWRSFDRFPPRQVETRTWYLSSGGRANSQRGDGRLVREAPRAAEPADAFVDDPAWPLIGAVTAVHESHGDFDLRERERDHETLVYDSGPLAEPLTLLGEGFAEMHVAVDAPDADLVLWLAEHRADGRTIRLTFGQLRLRYRDGFEQQRPLVPNEPVRARIPLSYVAHRLPAGSRLRLLVAGSNFPLGDPNPHTGEPVATATAMRPATQTVFHDASRPSAISFSVLP